MTTTICFIRHGQTNINNLKMIQGRKDNLLNDTGRLQAKETGLYLKKHDNNFDYIYCSPLSRAYETACIIKDIIGYTGDIIKDASFIERDFGDAEGQPITDEIFKYIIKDDINNLEKSYEIQKRVSDGVFNLHNKHKGKRILVVAHSHTIKGLLTFVDKKRTFLDPLMNCSMSYFNVIDDENNNSEIIIDKINITPNN